MFSFFTLLALKIGGSEIIVEHPAQIPSGGLAKFREILTDSVGILIFAVIVLSLFFLLWGGIQWISSGGDKTKLEAARNKIFYAIIGLIFSFLSFLMINILSYLFLGRANGLLQLPSTL